MENPATQTPNISSITKNHPSSFSSLSSMSQRHHHQLCYPGYHPQVNHPFMYSRASRPPEIGLSPQENTTHSLMDSNFDYRTNNYVYGVKEEVDKLAFFSEPCGTNRSFSGSSMDNSWKLTPLTMSSSSLKQSSCYGLQSESIKLKKGEPQKTVHRFFDEWQPKPRDSWLDLDDKSSNSSSVSTTRLSIAIASTSNDFPFSIEELTMMFEWIFALEVKYVLSWD